MFELTKATDFGFIRLSFTSANGDCETESNAGSY